MKILKKNKLTHDAIVNTNTFAYSKRKTINIIPKENRREYSIDLPA